MVEPAHDEAIPQAPDLGFDPRQPLLFWEAVRADFLAHFSEPERVMRGLARLGLFARVLLRSSGFRLTTLYRFAYAVRGRLGPLGKLTAAVASTFLRWFHGCSIAPTARLHGGLILPHPQGIVIGPDAVVGPRAWIFQNVTIGGSPGRDGLPVMGADCRVFPGAVLAGPITIGRNVVVGANAVVLHDIPERSLIRSPVSEVIALPDRWIVDDRTTQVP